jgi:Asp-tRNA(Asn)/Glu-tRNA(Gln) amidotransferase A subunit family amidase
MLELYGIDPESLNDDLRARLEREVEALRAQGAEVPPVMLEALDSLKSNSPPNDEVR